MGSLPSKLRCFRFEGNGGEPDAFFATANFGGSEERPMTGTLEVMCERREAEVSRRGGSR